MAFLDGLLGNWSGDGSSSNAMPAGYSNLTPDQQAMLKQQGWYPNPDMVLPSGVANTQPAGYSNLTPAQAATVNSLGYYSQPGATQGGSQSLWDKAINALGDPNTQASLKQAIGGLTPTHPQTPLPSPVPQHIPYMFGPYTIYRHSSLNPKQALANLQAGGISG